MVGIFERKKQNLYNPQDLFTLPLGRRWVETKDLTYASRKELLHETTERLVEFLSPMVPVFKKMDEAGLARAFIRHIGAILLLLEKGAVVFAKSTEGKIEFHDADLLIHYDKKKLDYFRVLLEPLVQQKLVKIISWIDYPSCGENTFSSTSFLQLAILDKDGKVLREIEMFSDFSGTKNGHSVSFASLNANGSPGGMREDTPEDEMNYVTPVQLALPGYDKSTHPCIYGKGVLESYRWQVDIIHDLIYSGNLKIHADKEIGRMTLMELIIASRWQNPLERRSL